MTRYNKDFEKEFEKAKNRFNDIALNTGREHLVLNNDIARASGARLNEPEAYPESWTLADLVAESDYQMNMCNEIMDGYSSEDKKKIRQEMKRWKNFRDYYLPLIKELDIKLFCNHCSTLLDVKSENTLFYQSCLENEEVL